MRRIMITWVAGWTIVCIGAAVPQQRCDPQVVDTIAGPTAAPPSVDGVEPRVLADGRGTPSGVRKESPSAAKVASDKAKGTVPFPGSRPVPEACRAMVTQDISDTIWTHATFWEAAFISGGPILIGAGRQLGAGDLLEQLGLSRAFTEGAASIDPLLGIGALALTGEQGGLTGESGDSSTLLASWSERAPDGLGSQLALVLAHGPTDLPLIAPRITHPLLQESYLREYFARGNVPRAIIEQLPFTDPSLHACRDALVLIDNPP